MGKSTHCPPQRPIYSSVPEALLLALSIIMTSACGWEESEGTCPHWRTSLVSPTGWSEREALGESSAGRQE